MENLIEKFFDEILYQRIISRAVDKLLSFAPRGLRKYSREIGKYLYAAVVGMVQRML